jgi:predicted Rossmann fold flavoprotein
MSDPARFEPLKVAVIGGGAAGFFAAFSVKEHHPEAEVSLFEKTGKLLAKVKVSGGGRCNVTHACFTPSLLSKSYPRGEKQMKKAFAVFQPEDTVKWFLKRRVELKAEDDGRMFPVSNDSQTIIDCFLEEARAQHIRIATQTAVEEITPTDQGFSLGFRGTETPVHFDKVIIATGGSPKESGLNWLKNLGHPIASPLPSLFTFNIPKHPIVKLMGLVVEHATVRIQGTKLAYSGPVLITHWGMSGPAVLKLSAWGARKLAEQNYRFTVQVNWLSIKNEAEVNVLLDEALPGMRRKKITNANPFQLPSRMWAYLIGKAEISPDAVWLDLPKKKRNKLINLLLNDTYDVSGKTTFKEEFVTCGGVKWEGIKVDSMESRSCPGLYFAGEVIDVDGITGGFNFQAAWTTGYIAGKLL